MNDGDLIEFHAQVFEVGQVDGRPGVDLRHPDGSMTRLRGLTEGEVGKLAAHLYDSVIVTVRLPR